MRKKGPERSETGKEEGGIVEKAEEEEGRVEDEPVRGGGHGLGVLPASRPSLAPGHRAAQALLHPLEPSSGPRGLASSLEPPAQHLPFPPTQQAPSTSFA